MPQPTLTTPTDRTCEVCGASITAATKSGVCKRTRKCRSEKHRRWRHENPEIWRASHARAEIKGRATHNLRRRRNKARKATRWTIGLHPIP